MSVQLFREAKERERSYMLGPIYVVPVEPCEHGNYARHLLTILEKHGCERVHLWCEGEPA